jgi:hypothetical protein
MGEARKKVRSWLDRLLLRLFPHEDILGRDGSLYMRRWRVAGYRARLPGLGGFNLMIHRIVRPDEDRDPHDHPWWFVSLLFLGRYIEERFGPDGTRFEVVSRRPGGLARRAATDLHRIDTLPDGEAWTLVLTGPRARKWGFMTPGGWVQHDRYFVSAGFPEKVIAPATSEKS